MNLYVIEVATDSPLLFAIDLVAFLKNGLFR
jgi:hypothetical protein